MQIDKRVLAPWVICWLSVLLLLGCGDTATDTLETEQLAEITRELRALRQEVAGIRTAVAEIHSAAVAPPSAPPPPPRVAKVLIDGDDPGIGNAEATVAIVEFSDYECPFCVRYNTQTFSWIKDNYIDTGKLRYISRDFPLDFHQNGKSASVAANCAGEQGKYMELRQALYVNQRKLGPELYTQLALEHGLDKDDFSACLDNPARQQEVDRDIAYGESLGVSATPTFFIGRIDEGKLVDAQRIVGARTNAEFKRFVDAEAPPIQKPTPGSKDHEA